MSLTHLLLWPSRRQVITKHVPHAQEPEEQGITEEKKPSPLVKVPRVSTASSVWHAAFNMWHVRRRCEHTEIGSRSPHVQQRAVDSGGDPAKQGIGE
jgi:hypothetical protein